MVDRRDRPALGITDGPSASVSRRSSRGWCWSAQVARWADPLGRHSSPRLRAASTFPISPHRRRKSNRRRQRLPTAGNQEIILAVDQHHTTEEEKNAERTFHVDARLRVHGRGSSARHRQQGRTKRPCREALLFSGSRACIGSRAQGRAVFGISAPRRRSLDSTDSTNGNRSRHSKFIREPAPLCPHRPATHPARPAWSRFSFEHLLGSERLRIRPAVQEVPISNTQD